ncbi:MAG: EAL domain-containing protein [Chloroflexaceae bacterium]|nr:EAL domain-containing protein [Chloroflexaceae bacterium]NJO04919.1 EAL domain-containing protein [Chloroflexaceae bacterium]
MEKSSAHRKTYKHERQPALELKQALARDQLVLFYQPIRHLFTRHIIAWEVLVRWEHPDWGMILPDALLPLAEESGLLRELDTWVLQNAFQQVAVWMQAGHAPPISLHLSEASLFADDLVVQVDTLLNEMGIPGPQVLFEIDWHMLAAVDPDKAAQRLSELQGLLAMVALDRLDGSVPLALLQQLPYDIVKIDRSCTAVVGQDYQTTDVIQTLLNMAYHRGATPIVTGVENDAQYEWLQQLGCEYAQGYRLDYPRRAEEIDLAAHADEVLDIVLAEDTPLAGALPQALAPVPFPEELSDTEAVRVAYADAIERIASYLDNNLSVLVICDKALVERIAHHAVALSSKTAVLADNPISIEDEEASHREALNDLLNKMQPAQVLVLHHLDVVVDNRADWPLINSARTLVMQLYRKQRHTPLLLAFTDPSLNVPRILRDRFEVRIEIGGLHRDRLPLLVTRGERDCFSRFDVGMLFKYVAHFNVIQLRQALRYLHTTNPPGTPTRHLLRQLQPFSHEDQITIEVPDVTFDEIGGYADVKRQVFEAIELITGRPVPYSADGEPYTPPNHAPGPETEAGRELRQKLAPRGFVFYGPPGTGKTLFAQAIANAMHATIQMINGPEIMSKWIGESESNLRQIFAMARRNTPAVIFFDEFDSIAGKRSGFNDSGSREMNAVVSQLLTELDGFDADQDLLVIGTTNRLDMIDKALLRPSRLQPIAITLPDYEARRQILQIHARSFQLAPPEDEMIDFLARHSEGFSGDELRSVMQGVARRARRGEVVDRETFQTQLQIVSRYHRDHHRLSFDGEDPLR